MYERMTILMSTLWLLRATWPGSLGQMANLQLRDMAQKTKTENDRSVEGDT